jgi:hypothetical protein
MGRARSSMSIAPPASDSVTNRRELEFSNQILKTKQDGTDRRAERQETADPATRAFRGDAVLRIIDGPGWQCSLRSKRAQRFHTHEIPQITEPSTEQIPQKPGTITKGGRRPNCVAPRHAQVRTS